MGRMKDIYIETNELIETVMHAEGQAMSMEGVLEHVGKHLDERGWRSPTEVAARHRTQRKIIVDSWARVIELGGTHDEAGVELAQALLDLAKAIGFSQRDLLGEAQDLVDSRKVVALSEKPDPVKPAAVITYY